LLIITNSACAAAGNGPAAQQLLQAMQLCRGDVGAWRASITMQAELLAGGRDGNRMARKLLEAGIGLFQGIRCGAQRS